MRASLLPCLELSDWEDPGPVLEAVLTGTAEPVELVVDLVVVVVVEWLLLVLLLLLLDFTVEEVWLDEPFGVTGVDFWLPLPGFWSLDISERGTARFAST